MILKAYLCACAVIAQLNSNIRGIFWLYCQSPATEKLRLPFANHFMIYVWCLACLTFNYQRMLLKTLDVCRGFSTTTLAACSREFRRYETETAHAYRFPIE